MVDEIIEEDCGVTHFHPGEHRGGDIGRAGPGHVDHGSQFSVHRSGQKATASRSGARPLISSWRGTAYGSSTWLLHASHMLLPPKIRTELDFLRTQLGG